MAKKEKPGSGLSVLVVDDELGIRGVCREFLETLGCSVEEAADLKTAAQALEARKFSLVLLDVRFPEALPIAGVPRRVRQHDRQGRPCGQTLLARRVLPQ